MMKKCFFILIAAFLLFTPLKAYSIVDFLDIREEKSFLETTGIKFFYKPNQKVIYKELLNESIKQNKTHLRYSDLSTIHKIAHNKAKKEVEFESWDHNTSSSPIIFDAVVYIKNTGKKTLINKRFLVDVKIKRGQLKEDPLILNKREVLSKSAVWGFYKSQDFTIPVLVHNEIGKIRIKDICLTDMKIEGVNIWPESLSISVREIDEEGNLNKEYLDYAILELTPNKFQVLPFWH